jgi:hypothetical protein
LEQGLTWFIAEEAADDSEMVVKAVIELSDFMSQEVHIFTPI